MQDSMAHANDAANDAVFGIREVRSFNTEKHEARLYDKRLLVTHNLKTRRDTVRAVYLLLRRVSIFFFCGCLSISNGVEPVIACDLKIICLYVYLQLTALGMQVFMLYYGRLFIQRGQMTTGNLVSFILYQSDLGKNIRVGIL